MKVLKQIIKNVQASTVLVESSKGNVYPVTIADKLRLNGKAINVGDIGIVHRVNGKYYLYDVEQKPDETDSHLADVPIEDMIGEY